MMDGFGAFALVMMLVGMVFCFAMLAGIVWLVGHWLNRKQGSLMPDTRQESSSGYVQGYRLSQPPQKPTAKVESNTSIPSQNRSTISHKRSIRRRCHHGPDSPEQEVRPSSNWRNESEMYPFAPMGLQGVCLF